MIFGAKFREDPCQKKCASDNFPKTCIGSVLKKMGKVKAQKVLMQTRKQLDNLILAKVQFDSTRVLCFQSLLFQS